MPFDAFNGFLVKHCLVYVAGLKLVTCPHIQGTIRAKSPKECALAVTGPTGDRQRFDRCRPSEVVGRVTRHLCPGNPVRLCVLQGDPTSMAEWPGATFQEKRVIWSQRLWETQHISIIKSFMCCDQVWNEPHQVLNRIKCFVREIQNISSTI
jgi:hypothetical protein